MDNNMNNNPFDDWGIPEGERSNLVNNNSSINMNTQINNAYNSVNNINYSASINNNVNNIGENKIAVNNNTLNNKIDSYDNSENKKGLIPLILSIINLVIAPSIVDFMVPLLVILIIFGGATGDFSNRDIYIFVAIIASYIIFSLLFVLISYIKYFKRSKTKKRKYILIAVGIVILLILYIDIAPIYKTIMMEMR